MGVHCLGGAPPRFVHPLQHVSSRLPKPPCWWCGAMSA